MRLSRSAVLGLLALALGFIGILLAVEQPSAGFDSADNQGVISTSLGI